MNGRGMNTAADLTSMEFDESFDAFDSLESDFDFAWSPQNTDLPNGSSGQPSATRVRFTALAGLNAPSLGLEGNALVTNLSPKGVSLSSSLDLDPGTRVEITIALGFASDEVNVEAEVLWRRYRDDAETVYGLAFCEPSPKVYEEINRTIQERCEGRVLEWELPWIPEESKVERFSWRTMMLGVAVGLAGAVGALGLTGLDDTQATAAAEAKGIRAIATGTAVVVEGSPEVTERAESATTPVLVSKNQAAEPSKSVESKPVVEMKPKAVAPAPKQPEVVVQKEVAPEVAPPKAKPAKSMEMAAPVTEEASAVEAIGPAWEVTAGKIQFRIPLDQGSDGVKWFALSEPNRLVVDVHSGSTPLVKKSYNIDHPWLNSLRVGRYEAKTRFVFDIDKGVKFDGDPKVTASGDWVTMTFMR